jgi:hypothetical protein
LTNKEYFFSDKMIVDTIMLLTYDNHPRKECRLFKKELSDMALRGNGNQLREWLDSEKDVRFNW